MPKRWMDPSTEPPEQRALRKRLAEEQSVAHTVAVLDKLEKRRREKAAEPAPEPEPPAPYVPPPELLELVRIWQSLSPRDQLELLYLARIKSSLRARG